MAVEWTDTLEHLVTTRNRRIAEKALYHGLDALKNPVLSVEEVAGRSICKWPRPCLRARAKCKWGKR